MSDNTDSTGCYFFHLSDCYIWWALGLLNTSCGYFWQCEVQFVTRNVRLVDKISGDHYVDLLSKKSDHVMVFTDEYPACHNVKEALRKAHYFKISPTKFILMHSPIYDTLSASASVIVRHCNDVLSS